MGFLPTYTARERRLHDALAHLMWKNHDLQPSTCEGCLQVAALLAVPGYLDTPDPYPREYVN